MFSVQVPPGVVPGSILTVQAPSGSTLQVQVPDGVPPGGIFTVQDPSATQPPPQVMGQPINGQPMMGQPVMYAPGQQMMAPQLQPVPDPFLLVASLPRVKVVEKMNLMETATGLMGELLGVDMELEMSNKYVIQNDQGHNMFFAAESTDFCNRQCGGDCRAIDIDVVVLGQDPELLKEANGQFDWNWNPLKQVDLSGSQKFIKLHKECQCTCCCFNRPVIDVLHGTTGEVIAKIKDPWACCDMTFDILDASEQPILTAKGGCCQLGLLCPCPCGPCSEVNFTVNDAQSGEEVASLKKKIPDCFKFIVADDVDNYEVEFAKVQDPHWKSVLMALALFIDFRYFNTRSDKNDDAADAWGGDGGGDGGYGDGGGDGGDGGGDGGDGDGGGD